MSNAPLRSARSAGSWWVLFALYLLVLTTATHWPNLRLPGRSPISDKGLHLLCFAILTILLWRTQWIRHRWLVLLLAAAWSVIDEISQGLPGLHRHVSWDDGLANLIGVGVAAAWLWALRPLGREPNRMRLAFQQLLFEEFFRHWRAWLIAVITFLICAVPVVLVWPRYEADEKSVPVFAGIAAWLVITPLLWAPFWVRRARALAEQKPCFNCGRSCIAATFDERGRARCFGCGSPIHAAQWTNVDPPTGRAALSLGLWPALIGIAVLAAGFAFITLSAGLYAFLLENDLAGRFLIRAVHELGKRGNLMNVIDAAAVLLLFAVVVRVYRGRLAGFYDRAVRCRRCSHDLRGTPTDRRGMGRCGECGTPFVRSDAFESPVPAGHQGAPPDAPD